jgi:3-methylcrotonyl-CoA carboxylase alpha subunit
LESYEIAGPVTNIEFLKKMCVSPAFVAGEVETGYISKHHDELFQPQEIGPEVFAQAAIGLVLEERGRQTENMMSAGPQWMIGTQYQQRAFHLTDIPPDGKSEPISRVVYVTEISPNEFTVTLDNTQYENVQTSGTSKSFSSFFPHTRLETTFIRDEDRLTLFQQGRQYRLQIDAPKWAEKALGIKDVTNSVLAPMPCKVLRVDVKEGDHVNKDQPLVVIESMKMEAVIRSPQDGIIAKIVHGEGV